MLLYALIALVVVVLIIAAAFVGPARFQALWLAIPRPWRTVLNVGVASLVAYGGPELIDAVSGSNLPPWLTLALVPFLTVVVRTANPADAYPKQAPPEPVDEPVDEPLGESLPYDEEPAG